MDDRLIIADMVRDLKRILVECKDKNAVSVIVPFGIDVIGDYAFFGCDSLKSVTIPDCVTKIGKNAFDNCTSLESVAVPDSVKEIGANAFANCYNLVDVRMSESLAQRIDFDNVFAKTAFLRNLKCSVKAAEKTRSKERIKIL